MACTTKRHGNHKLIKSLIVNLKERSTSNKESGKNENDSGKAKIIIQIANLLMQRKSHCIILVSFFIVSRVDPCVFSCFP